MALYPAVDEKGNFMRSASQVRNAAFLVLGALLLAAVAACGRTAQVSEIPADQAFAKEVKIEVTQGLTAARKFPAAGKSHVEVCVEKLSGYEKRPVGEFKDVYKSLLDGSKELMQMYDQKADTAKINAKIDSKKFEVRK